MDDEIHLHYLPYSWKEFGDSRCTTAQQQRAEDDKWNSEVDAYVRNEAYVLHLQGVQQELSLTP